MMQHSSVSKEERDTPKTMPGGLKVRRKKPSIQD
jgi:hypothetical protein